MLESRIVAGSPYFGGNPTHLLLAEQSRGLEDQTNILCSEGMNLTEWYESYCGVRVLLWSLNSSFGGLISYCECNPSLTAGLCSLRLLEASAALRKRYTAKINAAQNMILQQTKIRKANGNVKHTKLGLELGNINEGKGIINCMETIENAENK